MKFDPSWGTLDGMPKKFAAAKSLFNSTDPENDNSAPREQTVLTPAWLLDAIREVAPIGLDPCTTPENPVGARLYETAPDEYTGYLGGLVKPWNHLSNECAYVNPPFDTLKTWLRKCYMEAQEGTPVYLLCPVRPQRRWFNEYTKGYTVVSLAPFPFVGHKSAFPAPLCLVCYNLPVPPGLGKYETGRWVQL